jgi:hypothetical protein
MVFDDLFMMVSYMKKSKVPPNWTELVEKLSEHITDEDYDLAKTWLFPNTESGDIAMQTNQRPSIVPTGTHDAAPNAPSKILIQHDDLDIKYLVLIFLDPTACKEYPMRILSPVHLWIQSMRSCLRCKMRIQCLLSLI